MARYSFSQLEGLWEQAGGPASLAPVMAAIALAESSGDQQARNPSGAAGLWQILGLPFAGNPYDPLTNARMAVSKWHSQGLQAWVTYTSGAYRKFLQPGSPVPGGHFVPPPASGGGGPGLGGLLQFPAEIAGFFGKVTTAIDWLLQPSHWVRIIAGAAGIGMMATGVFMLSHAGGSL